MVKVKYYILAFTLLFCKLLKSNLQNKKELKLICNACDFILKYVLSLPTIKQILNSPGKPFAAANCNAFKV